MFDHLSITRNKSTLNSAPAAERFVLESSHGGDSRSRRPKNRIQVKDLWPCEGRANEPYAIQEIHIAIMSTREASAAGAASIPTSGRSQIRSLYVNSLAPSIIADLNAQSFSSFISNMAAFATKNNTDSEKLHMIDGALDILFQSRPDFTSTRCQLLKVQYNEGEFFETRMLRTSVPLSEAKNPKELITAMYHAMRGEFSISCARTMRLAIILTTRPEVL